MLQYLLIECDHVPDVTDPAVAPADLARAVDSVSDVDAPVFALLRSQLGLPTSDRRWWPAGGRHLTLVPDEAMASTLAEPTVNLLERVLAGLRA